MIGHQASARACGDDGDGDAHQACGSINFLFWLWKVLKTTNALQSPLQLIPPCPDISFTLAKWILPPNPVYKWISYSDGFPYDEKSHPDTTALMRN